MAEVQPEVQRNVTPQDLTTGPLDPWTDFRALAAEDPALVLRTLNISAHDVALTEEWPPHLDRAVVWQIRTANRQNAENPAPPERVERAQKTINQVLGTLAAGKAIDEKTAEHPLYKERHFRSLLTGLASKTNHEAEKAASTRVNRAVLGIWAYRIARQSFGQWLEELNANAAATAQSVPQQREPAQRGALRAA